MALGLAGQMDQRAWGPWAVVAALFGLVASVLAYTIAPASTLPYITDDFGISRAVASGLISTVFLSWALLQIPGGLLLDRYQNRRLLTLGMVVFMVSASAGVVVDTYVPFLVTRLVSGASLAVVFVGSINILSHTLPDDRRALGMSIFIAGPPFGIAAAQFSAPTLAETFGWQPTVYAYAVAAFASFLVFRLLPHDPVAAAQQLALRDFISVLGNRAVLLVSVTSLCTYAVWTYLVTWMPSYGSDVLGYDLAAAGAVAGLVPVAGIVARPLGGWVADRLGGRVTPVMMASFVLSIPLLVVLSQSPSPVVFAVVLAATGAAVNLGVGLYLVYVNSVAADASRGTSLSVLVTVSQVGNLISPVAGGWLISEYSYTMGFAFAVVLAVIGFVSIVVAPPAGAAASRH